MVYYLETHFPVTSWTAQGIHLWPLIRTEILYKNSGKKKVHQLGLLSLMNPVSLLRQLSSTIQLLYSKYSQTVLVVSSDTKRRDGGENSFTEYLFKKLDVRKEQILAIEHNLKKDMVIPRTGYQVFQLLFFFSAIAKVKATTSAYKYYLPKYDAVFNTVEQRYASMASIFVLDHIKIRAAELISKGQLLTQAFRKKAFSYVLMEEYYSINHMAICMAAHQLNIPVIEYQHGLQNTLHLAYGNMNKVPKTGYEVVPDIFWVWSEKEKLQIENWAAATKKHSAYAGGYSSIESEEKIEGSDGRTVLFTMQPVEDTMPQNLVDVIKETAEVYNWKARLHPNQVSAKESIKQLLSSKELDGLIDIETFTNMDMSKALALSDLHLTMWSSSVLEAARHGVPTIFIHEKGAAFFRDELVKLRAVYEPEVSAKVIRKHIGKFEAEQRPTINASIEEALSTWKRSDKLKQIA